MGAEIVRLRDPDPVGRALRGNVLIVTDVGGPLTPVVSSSTGMTDALGQRAMKTESLPAGRDCDRALTRGLRLARFTAIARRRAAREVELSRFDRCVLYVFAYEDLAAVAVDLRK
jgi:hypothetical protein